MLVFKLFQSGLYLAEGDISDPSKARVAFLFQDAGRTDPSFTLSQATWLDPTSQGYYAFFVPAANRDWSAFAIAVRNAFTGTQDSQFGWFSESPNVTPVTLVLVTGHDTQTPVVSTPFSLTFNNIALQVSNPFAPSPITFDDGSNSFRIENLNQQNIQLTAQPPGQPQQSYPSPSANLILPMDDTQNVHAASVSADFQFAVTDLASGFEAGFMYFGPGQEGLLTALSYPFLRAPGGAPAQLNFTAWLDVLQPLVDTRSYFQATDQVVGSYFTTANGKSFALTTSNGSDPSLTSRYAFANRPVNAPADTGNYYLTPAGSFGLSLDGAPAPDGPAALLCGVTGTEFLNVAVEQTSLLLRTGQPAFQQTTPSSTAAPPILLDSINGNVTTSWVSLVSTNGSYVSQPQESPLFDQNRGGTQTGSLNVFVLDFLPLPAWTASSGAAAAGAPVPSPLVPMVPYSGLVFATADLAAPYLAMESVAINPTRKNTFTATQSAITKQFRAAGNPFVAAPADSLTYAMTPQGLLAGLAGTPPNLEWQTTRIALSPDTGDILQFTAMGDEIRQALQQNQIFLVISTLTYDNQPLFGFAGSDQTINLSGWPFSLSPTGTSASDGTPPIVILKFYPGQSIQDLVADISLWSQPNVFNTTFTATQAQKYITDVINAACEDVYGAGKCPPQPGAQPNTSSLFYNFYKVVTDPQFAGLLALNCNMQLNNLPTAIRAVTGGMNYRDKDGNVVSNIDAFRVHHVGVAINDTDPNSPTPTLAQSSLFALVDYEIPNDSGSNTNGGGLGIDYGFEVQFLRALFTNSALTSFSCKINLTINNLFGTTVALEAQNGGSSGAGKNVVAITGSYQAHSTTGDDTTSGEGIYSFIAEGNFVFKFGTNPYLDNITLTKLQFSFLQETPASSSKTSNIQASFNISGSLVFKEFNVLDIFSFEKLAFNDLGIAVSFDLTIPDAPGKPTTSNLELSFSPGNLRLDLANTTAKGGGNSLLALLPFKLTSFLYNQFPDKQTVEDTGYYALTSVPLDPGFSLVNKFNYALLFDLDLGTLGALVGSLQAFKFSFLIGWLEDDGATAGGIAFGVQLPQADGKLEIKIEGVLTLLIEQFILRYQSPDNGGPQMLVLALHNSSIEILGQRLPPGTAVFDFALFAPTSDSARIGWIAAINNEGDGSGAIAGNGGDGGGPFQLKYLGLGQRVGPDPNSPPTNFKDFLAFMTGEFFEAISNQEYDKVYHPDSQWLALTDVRLLDKIQVGFIFYDSTPFYSLTLNVDKLFNFEITYTKVSDSIGLFYANFSLPDNLRTFQVGAASLTLPSIGISVYTNGNFRVDLGFPNNDDWSRSFRVQAQAGPIPITGSGGFYFASLSSATSSVFKGTYDSILAFGFAARLGVGKDFTAGPLKAGVSVTFFGIIQGAAGYRNSLSNDIFQRPDALQLQGQFGIIGELYGSIDFVIIKASVNVRLQASIGIILSMEKDVPGADGSILLYIEASVSVSVSVEIDLFLFSITISFSFRASFRFEWQLVGQGSTNDVLEAKQFLLARSATATLAATETLPLIPGFTTDLAIWYLPEGTVIFPATTGTGTPWIVSSLGIQYDNAPAGTPEYSTFKPFEKVTTQLVTWAVGQALGLPGFQYTVTQAQINALDQTPETLIGSIDYPTLLDQLAVFAKATVAVPTAPSGTTLFASTFPMPPFFQLTTTGRMNGTTPENFEYVFSSKNNVPTSYITLVDAYFNQLFVNQTSGGSSLLTVTAAADSTVPLVQEIFLNYFTGLIRGAVHQLLQTMQNGNITSAAIDTVIRAAVGSGQFATLSGQMSSSFRGGARLPYIDGLTVPGGTALKTTNAQYALLWQEIPAGSVGADKYEITLSNPTDSGQKWITSTASFEVTSAFLQPFQTAQAADIVPPTAPVQLPFTSVGPQAFAFENSVVWTKPDTSQVSLRPFISALQNLQATQGAVIKVLVESRQTGAPYLPGGTPLPPSTFAWTTQIPLTVSQIPDNKGKPLPDVFALTGASQSAQLLLEQIIAAQQAGGIIASVQVLYQTASGSTGLTSKNVNPADVFVLRTNTTTVSTPPSAAFSLFAVEAEPPEVPVGAQIDDFANFLQIIQQAAVTNATGYYLRYLDTGNNSLPTDLFASGPAPLTILITYLADNSQNTPASPAQIQPYYNSIVLNAAQPALTYYAETTDPALALQYGSVAAGSIGALLTRDDAASNAKPHVSVLATTRADASRGHRRSELRRLILDAGITDEAQVNQMLADSGGNASQLNALYSLITYQVAATSGFVLSNLSAPIQPQQPDTSSSNADGLTGATDGTRSYRVYAPLYNLATANQPITPDKTPNRYASIGSPVSINFFQNDAFGNQTAVQLNFASTNFYFDPIVPLDQWQGVVTAYDFFNNSGAQPNTFTVYLNPSAIAFTSLTIDQAASALQAYTTILDQITGPGVTFAIETNLALQSNGSMVEIPLAAAQASAITTMVTGIVTYLENFTIPAPPFDVAPVALTVAATGPGTIPPAFEIAVLLDIRRDPNLISPTLKDQFGNVTFPSAQQASTTIVSTVGTSLSNGAGSVDITTFAKFFVQAFPKLALSVGLNGAQSTSSATASSFAVRRSNLLKTTGVPSDGSAPSQASPQSLWAVQQTLLKITIGTTAKSGPFYLSPEPLDNTLNSATVPLPPLPDGLRPPNWPATQLFTDVDLDQINSVFFSAVDAFLQPASAAHTFEIARPAYVATAQGRGSIAALYSLREVDWLFAPEAPFTGTPDQLEAAQAAFEQQMRAALATAYTTDTLVQFGVSFTTPPPSGVDNFYELFGSIQLTGGAKLPEGYTLSSPHVPITSSGSSFLTFLFGVADVHDEANVELDLEFNVTHVQHFLEDAPPDPGEARASIWLQLVNPYPNGLPHVGNGATDIPLVLREYPTPPTVINQQAPQGSGSQQSPPTNPLVAAAAWHFIYAYQAQITAHDLIGTAITYNTDLRASQGDGSGLNADALAAPGAQLYSLFQALARFSATYPVILPSLGTPADPNAAAAAQVFANLVTDVVTNTTWSPPPSTLSFGQAMLDIEDAYTVTDVAQPSTNSRLITLSWDKKESSFAGAELSVLALAPSTLAPYPNQFQGRGPNSVTDQYTPDPPLTDDMIVHQVEVDNLNVLAAENALSGVQIERNRIVMDGFTAKPEFIYMTPIVRATTPITPLVDNSTPIDITTLPNQNIGSGCPVPPPPGVASLCQRIYTVMFNLLADNDQLTNLQNAQLGAGLDASTPRRVKVASSFQYPVSSAGGVTSANPVSPLVPVVLARSFLIDGSQPAQLSEFSSLYATAVATWAQNNAIVFGNTAQPGARFVFDITLYAQLSGLNTPLLRLRNLFLKLTDVAPS